jgi:hypothetical protein
MMVKFNSPIKKHCLIVEGQRDKEFFLKYFSLQRGGNHDLKVEKLDDIEKELNVKTENLKGIDKLKTLFTEKTDELEKYQSIIVIADADTDYAARRDGILTTFQESGFNVQQANQIFCCPLKQKAVGVFILGEAGDNPRFNDLESLLYLIRTKADLCYQSPQKAFERFSKTTANKPNKPFKSRLNIYTAYMPTFTDNQLGGALKEGYFDKDAKVLTDIFQELINHLSKNQDTNNPESH